MARNTLQAIKAVLPNGKTPRRLPIGIARGIKLDIDFSTQTKMFLGLYEIELNRYLRRLCRPGFTSFDIGAQFGYDALVLAKLSRAKVASFECDADVFVELTRNVGYNDDLRPQIQLFQRFVASETESLSDKASLDDMVFGGEVFMPDFIKMDIEGGEFDALMGARRVLEEHHPNLLVETHSSQLERECLDLVKSFGYRPAIIDARKIVPDYRPVEHNRWFAAVL